MRHAIVTGGAGFIGSHLADRLLAANWRVTCIDNFDPFYDRTLKLRNVAVQLNNPAYSLVELDVRDLDSLLGKIEGDCDVVIHLAAKAGVRPSIVDPVTCQEVNVAGTQNMLEVARRMGIRQFIFASSSSVYGTNPNLPWREDDHVLEPISPYASTKISGELLGHVYSQLYEMRFIALRFFTVYGPRQRPDLAIYKFARLILDGRSIPIYGDGSTRRDYTHVSDIVEGVMAAIEYQGSDYEVINLGNHDTVRLLEMVTALGDRLGTHPQLEFQPEQPGDVPRTYADISKAQRLLGYSPKISLAAGLDSLTRWLERQGQFDRTRSMLQDPARLAFEPGIHLSELSRLAAFGMEPPPNHAS